MICPTCGTHIPDGSLRCPACHASVGITMAMPAIQGRWCPSCGAGVGWQDEVCPSCGFPLEREWGTPTDPAVPMATLGDAPKPIEEQVDETADTRAIPRIESAIPPEDDPTSKVAALEVMPHTSRFVLAAVASVLLVCGLALAITHPWNPDANSIRATKEADTSMAGFPGTVETLSGQDSDGSGVVAVPSGDDATLAQLVEAYGKLGRYAERADQSRQLFDEVAFGSDLDERTRGRREAEALAIDVSNLIARLEEVDVTSGLYAEERDNLLTLGNWLRNRVDTLSTAWKAAVDASDPAAERDEILAILKRDDDAQGANAYKTYFDDNYEAWEPKHKDAD